MNAIKVIFMSFDVSLKGLTSAYVGKLVSLRARTRSLINWRLCALITAPIPLANHRSQSPSLVAPTMMCLDGMTN